MLLYCYASYSVYDPGDTGKLDFIADLWTVLVKFLRMFSLTAHPNTLLWILEIYHLFSHKHMPIEILNRKSIRGDMHKHMNPIFEHIGKIIAEEVNLVYRPEKKRKFVPLLP
jgi:hypothetical protein